MNLVNNESVNHPNKIIPNVYRLGSVKKIRGEEFAPPLVKIATINGEKVNG